MDSIEEYRLGDEVLRVYADEDPQSPREWDNLGKIIGWHKRYKIGDENNDYIENCFLIDNRF
jgi:hypothetical protein